MTSSWVLMYHRVCSRGPETECWFARGTAVTPDAFAAQLRWTCERFDVVGLDELLSSRGPLQRPRVALTFDDGYTEVLRLAEPICRELGAVGTCFASAGPAQRREPLWFDVWYACVQSGHRDAALRQCVSAWDVEVPEDLAGWVSGPPKRWLAALSLTERTALLAELAAATSAKVSPDLYLTVPQLVDLRHRGWTIGGHGSRHARLTDCTESERSVELSDSQGLLDEVGQGGSRSFAYPDGAWDGSVATYVLNAGFATACTVDRGPVTPDTPRHAVPRVFCRGDTQIPHPLLATVARA